MKRILYIVAVMLSFVLGGPIATPQVKASQRFQIEPKITLLTMYDSNIRLVSGSSEDDFITQVSPEVSSNLLLRFGEVNFSYAPTLFIYAKNFDDAAFERFAHNLNLNIVTNITGRLSLLIDETFTAEPAALNQPEGLASNILQVNTVSGGLRFELPLSQQMEAMFEGRFGRTDVFDFNSDNLNGSLNLDLRRDIDERLRVGLNNRAGLLFYDDATFDDLIIYSANIWGEYDLDEYLTVKLPVGVQLLFNETSSNPDFGFNIDGTLESRYFSDSVLVLNVRRSFTVDAQGRAFALWQVALGYSLELNRKLSLDGNVRYLDLFNEDPLTLEDNDIIIDSTIGFTYQMQPNFLMKMGANLYFNRGRSTVNDFDLFQPYIGITYEFNRQ